MIGPAGPTLVARPARGARPPAVDLDRSGVTIRSGTASGSPDATCRARRHRRIDAVARRRQLPGRVPQSTVDPYLLGRRCRAGSGRRSCSPSPARRPPTGRSIRQRRLHRLRARDRAVTYVVGAAFGGTKSSVTLVLAGVAMVSLTTAIQTFLLQRHSEVVREVYNWILGRLSSARGRTCGWWRRTSPAARSCCVAPTAPRPAADRRRRGGDARGRPSLESGSSSWSRRRSHVRRRRRRQRLDRFVGIGAAHGASDPPAPATGSCCR